MLLLFQPLLHSFHTYTLKLSGTQKNIVSLLQDWSCNAFFFLLFGHSGEAPQLTCRWCQAGMCYIPANTLSFNCAQMKSHNHLPTLYDNSCMNRIAGVNSLFKIVTQHHLCTSDDVLPAHRIASAKALILKGWGCFPIATVADQAWTGGGSL